MLVVTNQLLQAADHDFSTISVTPTVVLLHHIPADVEDSWYHGIPNIYLKLHATEPSTAVRNAKEIADIIIDHYGGKKELVPPILGIYTDGGPEHSLNFLSVQIAYIALQWFLDLDMLIVARTAPGHSFKNPPEKVDCILNLALYGIGCMWKEIHEVLKFEKKLGNCSGVNDIRTLISEDPEKNTKLLCDSCQLCLDLIKSSFERLSLKGDQFVVWDYVLDDSVDAFFEEISLDTELSPKDTVQMLPKCPKLNMLLKHSTKQCTYLYSIKKCGESNCSSCKKPWLLTDVFQKISHLPDPVPDEDNPNHYKKFADLYGQDTIEEFKLSRCTSNRNHTIPFNPLKQHALNMNITLACTECGKHRVVYSQKKAGPRLCKKLKSVFSELFFTCGTKIQELDCNEYLMLYLHQSCWNPILQHQTSSLLLSLWQEAPSDKREQPLSDL